MALAEQLFEESATWPEIRAWRQRTRQRLLAARLGLLRGERLRASAEVAAFVQARRDMLGDCVGLYWPIRGEIDLRALAPWLHAHGVATALPVVVEPRRPLEFWAWTPDTPLQRGVWNIPVPTERRPCSPTAIVAPLLGFDSDGYRLGWGGGYYDRTLAALPVKPLAIGVGHECGRLPTIRPQPHDVPMDVIVTPQSVHWIDRPAPASACRFDDEQREDGHGQRAR